MIPIKITKDAEYEYEGEVYVFVGDNLANFSYDQLFVFTKKKPTNPMPELKVGMKIRTIKDEGGVIYFCSSDNFDFISINGDRHIGYLPIVIAKIWDYNDNVLWEKK